MFNIETTHRYEEIKNLYLFVKANEKSEVEIVNHLNLFDNSYLVVMFLFIFLKFVEIEKEIALIRMNTILENFRR